MIPKHLHQGARIAEMPFMTLKNKPLKIGYKKTCDCNEKHISCITAKEWMTAMCGIKEFYYTKRDIRDKNIHPAVFPIALPTHFINTLTHKGELVIDPFVGSGSTLIAAHDLKRNAVGFDLLQKYVNLSNDRVNMYRVYDEGEQFAICDDALNIGEYFEEETISLSITSPPYPKFLTHKRRNKSYRGNLRKNQYYNQIQQYSKDPRDVGNMNHLEYTNTLREIYAKILPLMKHKSHCIININDLWKENRRYPTHICVIKALTEAGFELRNTFIWDKRNLVNKVGIFGWPSNFISMGATFEYILDFWRPPDKRKKSTKDSLDDYNSSKACLGLGS